ncbi:MAG: hypothetical protein ACOVNY_09820, partial [Chitinophagaceae bacterium]
MLKELLLLPLTLSIRSKAIKTINTCSRNRIFLFDIDNTIADTIPSFEHYSNVTEARRISTLAFFIKMHRLIKILKRSPNNKIIFLTARGIKSKQATIQWLTEFGFPPANDELFIVRNASEKISILKKVSTDSVIYFIDDLAYLEKNGTIQVYNDLLKKVEKLKLKYFGLHQIKNA